MVMNGNFPWLILSYFIWEYLPWLSSDGPVKQIFEWRALDFEGNGKGREG
jgi:hypothetical protein